MFGFPKSSHETRHEWQCPHKKAVGLVSKGILAAMALYVTGCAVLAVQMLPHMVVGAVLAIALVPVVFVRCQQDELATWLVTRCYGPPK